MNPTRTEAIINIVLLISATRGRWCCFKLTLEAPSRSSFLEIIWIITRQAVLSMRVFMSVFGYACSIFHFILMVSAPVSPFSGCTHWPQVQINVAIDVDLSAPLTQSIVHSHNSVSFLSASSLLSSCCSSSASSTLYDIYIYINQRYKPMMGGKKHLIWFWKQHLNFKRVSAWTRLLITTLQNSYHWSRKSNQCQQFCEMIKCLFLSFLLFV